MCGGRRKRRGEALYEYIGKTIQRQAHTYKPVRTRNVHAFSYMRAFSLSLFRSLCLSLSSLQRTSYHPRTYELPLTLRKKGRKKKEVALLECVKAAYGVYIRPHNTTAREWYAVRTPNKHARTHILRRALRGRPFSSLPLPPYSDACPSYRCRRRARPAPAGSAPSFLPSSPPPSPPSLLVKRPKGRAEASREGKGERQKKMCQKTLLTMGRGTTKRCTQVVHV